MSAMRPEPHTLSRSIRVDAPPAKVWELLTNVARVIEWYDTWDSVEHATGEERLRVGMSFQLVRHRLGRDDTALCRVTSVEPLRRLSWLQHGRRRPPMSVEFQLFADTEGDTNTWVKHTRTWLQPGQLLS